MPLGPGPLEQGKGPESFTPLQTEKTHLAVVYNGLHTRFHLNKRGCCYKELGNYWPGRALMFLLVYDAS